MHCTTCGVEINNPLRVPGWPCRFCPQCAIETVQKDMLVEEERLRRLSIQVYKVDPLKTLPRQ